MDDIETTLQLITLLSISEKQTTLNIFFVKSPPQNTHPSNLTNNKTIDLNGTILYLLSDESKYVNGQNIIIDDGWSL
tara:strand:+ start:633 stop:863 length:231 start_codon:yes stop_codon:yes gene_type:complete